MKNELSVWIRTNSNAPETPRSARRVIESFLELPEGWHFGEGRNATDAAFMTALEIDRLFQKSKARIIEAFPDTDGGVSVCGRFQNEDLEVFCSPDGLRLSLCHEKDDDPIYEVENAKFEDVREYITEWSWAWKSSDYCIRNFIVSKESDSRAGHLRTPPMGQEPQFFAHSALVKRVGRNAGTFDCITTRTRQETPLSFGDLIQKSYQMARSWNMHPQQMTSVT